jgi:hypothetical protein
MKLNRREMVAALGATTAVAILAMPSTVLAERKIKILEEYQIIISSDGWSKAFAPGDVVTKRDIDETPGCEHQFDSSEPGFFEMMIDEGSAEYV